MASYYLQLRPSLEWIDFIGPSGKDSMHRKLNKMPTASFATGDCLSIRRAGNSARRNVVSSLKGRFFQQWNVDFRAIEGIDSHQPTGTWIRSKDFIQQFIFSDKRWKIRRHPRWIAPYLTTDEAELLDTKQVMEAPLERDRFLMLSEMESCAQGLQEKHR